MTPREVNDRLCDMAESVCRHLLPNGKRDGQYWKAGSVNGEAGDSLVVNLNGVKAGIWADHNGGVDRGDLLELWRRTRNVAFPEALREAKAFAGIRDTKPEFLGPQKRRNPVVKPAEVVSPSPGLFAWFKNRGISEKTVNAFKIEKSGDAVVFPYYAPDGTLNMLKYRNKDNKTKTWTTTDPWKSLFGWQAIPDEVREVVITEGEPDAMCYYEQGWPALSVPFGGGGSGKQDWIDRDYDNLERFDTIYLSMDMDQTGQAAIPEIVERLGRHRVRVINLPMKDANECHLAGLDLHKFIAESKSIDPVELRAASEFAAEVWEKFEGKDVRALGIKTPWDEKLNGNLRFRRGEVTLWLGYNGHGKSKGLSQMAAFGIKEGTKWCIASMEMRPKETLHCMYQQAGAVENPSKEYFDKITSYFTDKLWLFDVHGTAKAQKLFEVFLYARRKYGVDHFVVDSLSKCGLDEDDYNGQKHFIDKATDFAHEHDCHIHIVHHSRKGEDEYSVPGKMDAKGTGAITDMVDNVITWWRNKRKEEKVSQLTDSGPLPDELARQPDAVMSCNKQRHHDWEGKISFDFHVRCHTFTLRGKKPEPMVAM